METIWKYEFKVDDTVTIKMPIGAKVLSVGTQKLNHIAIWALVKPELDTVSRTFYIRGTGHPLNRFGQFPNLEASNFIGTVIDGPFIWHIFGEK